MRLLVVSLIVVFCLFPGMPVSEAAVLEDKKNEWSFAMSSLDTDDVGESTDLEFQWAWIFSGGHHQLGVAAEYFSVEFDDPLFADADGSAFGPAYQFNWTPKYAAATGFGFAEFLTIGGDSGDVFDTRYSIGVGAKAFVGESASILVRYSFDRFQGTSGFSDLDQRRLEVGIAIYSGRR